jgi:hypothetical protein
MHSPAAASLSLARLALFLAVCTLSLPLPAAESTQPATPVPESPAAVTPADFAAPAAPADPSAPTNPGTPADPAALIEPGSPNSKFPYTIPFTTREEEAFKPGDSIKVLSVYGNRPRLETGGTYQVKVAYTFSSVLVATLALSIATSEASKQQVVTSQGTSTQTYSRRATAFQRNKLERGSGSFAFTLPMKFAGTMRVGFGEAVDETGKRYQASGTCVIEPR